jgi:hypothetical protein
MNRNVLIKAVGRFKYHEDVSSSEFSFSTYVWRRLG